MIISKTIKNHYDVFKFMISMMMMMMMMKILVIVGVTILLSLTVFLLLVAETMPPTSDAVPLIGNS